MTDIPNTRYITVDKDGIFVGGKPARAYRFPYKGNKIQFMERIESCFAEIQRQNPEVQELHIGLFETEGIFAKTGNPSGKSEKLERYAWARVKLFDGRLGPWVLCGTYISESDCAAYCASNCGYVRSEMLKFANIKPMTDIPNTRYITMNKDGVFVGGEPATTYNGEKIGFFKSLKSDFAKIQRQVPEVQEFHAGSFEAMGIYAETGSPYGNFGKYAWARVKLSDGRLGPWVFCDTYRSDVGCMIWCISECCNSFQYDNELRSAMLIFAKEDEETNTENKQKEQSKIISAFKIGSFKIMIERIKQR